MKKFLRTFLEILFPSKPSIQKLEAALKSKSGIHFSPSPQSPFPWIHPLFAYKDKAVREFIWEIKYTGNEILLETAGSMLADEILSYFDEHGLFVRKEWCLIPIPASKVHQKEKGFNQTEELCIQTLKHLDSQTIMYIPHAIKKTRETSSQASVKDRSIRLRNLIGTFTVDDASMVKGKNIILIDDVATTGSTFVEAKRALKESGAKEVIAFAVAH